MENGIHFLIHGTVYSTERDCGNKISILWYEILMSFSIFMYLQA